MGLILVRPSIALKEKALNFRQEHFDSGERVINGSEMFDNIENYEDWLEGVTNNANIETVNKNWVLTDTFFAYEKNTDKIIGIIDLRHELNDFLKDFGNCGYSVRPSERKKGYATKMLEEIKKIAKDAGMKRLQISVEKTNTPSIKVIKRNGGVYERSFEYEGETADIYMIDLL